MNRVTFVEEVVRDLRQAMRMIRTKPAFSVSALLSLALGIGANVAIFSLVNCVLLRPLPYPEPESLVGVFNSGAFQGQVIKDMPLSLVMYTAYKESVQALEEFGVWIGGTATVTGIGEPEQVATVAMTEGVLPALRVQPYLGRWFSREDDAQGAPKPVILSYGYWQRKFLDDRNVLGRTVLINFVPRQVVGIMPRSFHFLDLAPDVLLLENPRGDQVPSHDFNHSGIARLKPGVTIRQANSDLARGLKIWSDLEGARQSLEQLQLKPNLRPLKEDVVGPIRTVLRTLMLAVALVLLLVCANVANLVQVRMQARREEFAIRTALGARWGRLVRALLAESLTLGVLGGAIGLALAYVGLRVLVTRAFTPLPRLSEISIDLTTVLFALACSLGSSMLFGFIAILKLGRNLRPSHVRGVNVSKEQLRAQDMLVVTQIAFALVLLTAAGLMTRSFLGLRAIQPGFTRPEQIQTARILIPGTQIREPERVVRIEAEILDKLRAIPGVTAAGFATSLPIDSESRNGNVVAIEGKTRADEIPPNRTTKYISPGFFAVLGTSLIAGRDFTWTDVFSQHHVAVISANMARENWGKPQEAIGKRIRIGKDGPWTDIVGVVKDIYEDGVDRPPSATVYLRAGVYPPLRPGGLPSVSRGVAIAVRSDAAGTESLVREIAAAVHSVNPDLPLAKVRTLNDIYRSSTARTSFALVLLGIAGAMALTMSVIGIYGLLAYAVAQRRREVGVRLALGAEPGQIMALFVRHGLILACVGTIIGLTSAAAVSHWISSLLFNVTPFDLVTYALAAVITVTSAAIASYIPAQRAASVHPMDALRSE